VKVKTEPRRRGRRCIDCREGSGKSCGVVDNRKRYPMKEGYIGKNVNAPRKLRDLSNDESKKDADPKGPEVYDSVMDYDPA
jgi:hypothetical protein